MNIKSTLLAVAGVLSISAPAMVHADPWDNGYDQGRQGDQWRGDQGGDHRRDGDSRWRRESEWRRHHGYGWGHRTRCWTENRGYYNWRGDYVYRHIRVCR